MLINFTVENWKSFRNKASFTMLATSERQHRERIADVKKYRARLLPTAVIYGGNASGKTNFFQAMRFVKDMVLRGTGVQPDKPINIEPFRLDPNMEKEPCRFKIEMLVDEIIYELMFTVTRTDVIEEKLTKITSSTEKVLYDRKGDNPNFDVSLEKNEALRYAFKGTRNNQLFLTNAVSQKNEVFLPVHKWFKDSLVFVTPNARIQNPDFFFEKDSPYYFDICRILPLLDTGIVGLVGKILPFDNLPIPSEIIRTIQNDLEEGHTALVSSPLENLWFAISINNGIITAQKLVTKHHNIMGDEVEFEMRDESDGSKRVIDLLPAFLAVSAKKTKKVYIIDELDRSLHTLLSRQLIEFYLDTCSPESRSQLIFTTHDLMLMDQDIFRRDEMWVSERKNDGNTSLFSFSEYKDLRYDKDIRKSYLEGRLGGTPKILFNSTQSACLEVD